MSTDNYRAGARVLAQMGHSLDARVRFTQLPELAEFARAVPDLTIVLNHLAGLWRIGPFAGRDDEVLPAWKKGLAEVAACPNVYIKLGGIGMPRMGFDWYTRDKPIGSEDLAKEMASVITPCIEVFGPERCMFESNFPVGQGVVLAPRAVQRLQALLEGLLAHRAGGHVPRHGGQGVPDQLRLTGPAQPGI